MEYAKVENFLPVSEGGKAENFPLAWHFFCVFALLAAAQGKDATIIVLLILAGNMYEWTLECDYPSPNPGCSCRSVEFEGSGSNYPASVRHIYGKTDSSYKYRF